MASFYYVYYFWIYEKKLSYILLIFFNISYNIKLIQEINLYKFILNLLLYKFKSILILEIYYNKSHIINNNYLYFIL